MIEENLTHLEKNFLEEVLRPSITISYATREYWFGRMTTSETLNFKDLLSKLKEFYEKNGGQNWSQILDEAI